MKKNHIFSLKFDYFAILFVLRKSLKSKNGHNNPATLKALRIIWLIDCLDSVLCPIGKKNLKQTEGLNLIMKKWEFLEVGRTITGFGLGHGCGTLHITR